VEQIESYVQPPRFDNARPQTADEIAADLASLREYQQSRTYQVPMGVELAEAGISLSDPLPLVQGLDVQLGATPTQVVEETEFGYDNRIASLVLGSNTVALDRDGNPLPL
jgi:hypothetical protein